MEKKYIFFMTNNSKGTLGTEALTSILQSKIAKPSPKLSWLGQSTSVHAAQLCLCCDPDNIHQPPEIKWYDVTDGTEVFEEHLHHECPDQLVDQGRTMGLSENLHELANQLPENGMFLDILWPFEVVKHLSLGDHVALFGALKRLVEWHGASLHVIVPPECLQVPPGVQEWLDLLHGAVVTADQLHSQLTSCLWRGQVNVTGSKDTKALTLPHFCLSTYQNTDIQEPQTRLRVKNDDIDTDIQLDQAFLPTGCLEFVAAVQLSQIPSFYITHYNFSLSVPSSSKHLSKSKSFLEKLKENSEAAYILRLRYGSRWKATVPTGRGRTQQRQKEWKELVMDNIANVTDHKRPSDVDGDVGHCQFVVCFQKSPSGGSYVAYLLRPPGDLNGQVAMDLAKDELRHGVKGYADPGFVTPVDSEIQQLLTKLAHYRGKDLVHLNASAETIQVAALKECIEKRRGGGEKPELAVDELLSLLRTIRHQTWETLCQSGIYTSQRPPTRHKLLNVRPEYEYDVLSQWEGVALRLHDVNAGDQQRKRRSDDSLGGLAPPTGQILTLDANEFLRHFNEDGSAVRTDSGVLRPLRSPSRRFCKYNSGDLTKSEWPDCLRARDHDVYYNCEERAAVERQCERMKTRLQAMETASTCTLQQARGPPTITINHTTEGGAAGEEAPRSAKGERAPQDTDNPKAPRESRRTSKSQPTKRKAESTELVSDSKRLLVERKKRQEVKMRQASQQKASRHKDDLNQGSAGESRSQRHKRKLQEVVEQCIVRRGVTKDESIYSACVNKLFMLAKCFVKDLKTSHNLRQEMENIAESHVEQVIEFEKRIKTS